MDEFTTRIIFAVFFFSFLLISASFRVRANKLGDKFDVVKKEGVSIAIFSRIIGLSLTVSSFLYIFYPFAIEFAKGQENSWLTIFGILLCLFSLPFIIWTFKSLGNNITETVEMRQSNQLIKTGMYKYIRHPIYTTTFFFNFGLALISLNWLIGLIAISLFAIMILRTTTEEKILIEKYGDDYLKYMKITGRHFPILF